MQTQDLKVSAGRVCASDRNDKAFTIILFVLAIELVFFKFLPDLGTATLPGQFASPLADFKFFRYMFMTRGSITYPRFAGTWLMFGFAKVIGGYVHSSDVRLHPLRIAASILTPLYAVAGLVPVMTTQTTRYCWKTYAALYCTYCTLSLYVFYPYDMPSIALLSIAAFLVLEDRISEAIFVMLLTGLFRESSLHAVWLVVAWSLCNSSVPRSRRAASAVVCIVAFAAEYAAIRITFPSHGQWQLNVHEIFLGRGLWSLTCIVTLAAVFIVPLHYLACHLPANPADWRANFFVLNCVAVPFWVVFYRIMGGNISELRLILPALIPIFYGQATPVADADHW
jgi:hypothetical protein